MRKNANGVPSPTIASVKESAIPQISRTGSLSTIHFHPITIGKRYSPPSRLLVLARGTSWRLDEGRCFPLLQHTHLSVCVLRFLFEATTPAFALYALMRDIHSAIPISDRFPSSTSPIRHSCIDWNGTSCPAPHHLGVQWSHRSSSPRGFFEN